MPCPVGPATTCHHHQDDHAWSACLCHLPSRSCLVMILLRLLPAAAFLPPCLLLSIRGQTLMREEDKSGGEERERLHSGGDTAFCPHPALPPPHLTSLSAYTHLFPPHPSPTTFCTSLPFYLFFLLIFSSRLPLSYPVPFSAPLLPAFSSPRTALPPFSTVITRYTTWVWFHL